MYIAWPSAFNVSICSSVTPILSPFINQVSLLKGTWALPTPVYKGSDFTSSRSKKWCVLALLSVTCQPKCQSALCGPERRWTWWKRSGASVDDVISRIKSSMSYPSKTWHNLAEKSRKLFRSHMNMTLASGWRCRCIYEAHRDCSGAINTV